MGFLTPQFSFYVANSNNAGTLSGHCWRVEATVLPKVTTKLPTLPVPFSAKWKHLQGLQLANQQFGVQNNADIVLGADVLGCMILHGQRRGPLG